MNDEAWACYVTSGTQPGWVVDTGVGGTYSWDVSEAKWWPSKVAMRDELEKCELIYTDARALDYDAGIWYPDILHYTAVRVK